MSLFEFCIEIIKREGTRFNVGVNACDASQITAATASDINFDNANNRCAFLYRRGAISLSLAKDCFKNFLSDDKSIVFLLSKWIKRPNLTVCSLSKGPALDYIALLLAYQESGAFPSLFKNIKVVSKYGAWRNTVNIMLEILNEGYLKSLPSSVLVGNIEVIQGDPFENLSEKVKQPICDSDIVLMVKTLNLQTDGFNQAQISKALQEFLGAMKQDAILLCIDTKPSISIITRELSSLGKFLYEPTHINTSIDLEFADFYKNIFGCTPVLSARGSFFVWQKSSTVSTPNMKCLMDEVSESVKHLLRVNRLQSNDCSKLPEEECKSEQHVIKDTISLTSTDFAENCDILLPNKNLKSVETKEVSQQSVANDINTQNSKYVLPSSSSQCGISSHDNAKKRGNTALIKESNSISSNQAIQTEAELKVDDSINISELTNRIAKLTTAIGEIVQSSESSESMCTSDGCLSNSETESKHSAVNNCIHSHCPSLALCMHNCQWPNCHTACKYNQKPVFENCCQNNTCQPGFSGPNQYNSNASLNSDVETPKCCCSCHNGLKFPSENNSVSPPQLVIPLNNLSGNVISQILSLLSQSNHE